MSHRYRLGKGIWLYVFGLVLCSVVYTSKFCIHKDCQSS